MPIFDYQCVLCNNIERDIFVHSLNSPVICSKCQGETVRLFPVDSRFVPDVFPTDGIFLEHVSAKGKRFYSKKEMIQYARKHNLELGALL